MQKKIEENILKGNITFRDDVSADAKEAISRMTDPNMKKRICSSSLLNLNFFKKHEIEKKSNEIIKDISMNNQMISKLSEFKQALLKERKMNLNL